jgi:hypothetical protein
MRNSDKQVWLERIVRALEELKEGVQVQTVDQRTFSSRGSEPSSSAQRGK